MAIIKCKMCGGDLEILEDSSVCECEYCGTRQTVPSADSEKKLTLFNRAGRLLRNCEFDKAAGVFETIVADFPEEAEAYWGLVLCKYGIEYVDDPATGKKIPTCHRSSFDSVEDDTNFEQACENADSVARRLYREEARQIEILRQRILEVSGKEEPYDVFISYKELDADGERTPDSVIAQDIYRMLTKEGYRVFFSRISLEGKLGVEYEPYIFAALNSAKVMIVVGTDYDYLDAVWVKNEWSRFLKLIASGQPKTIIPVYKDMDPYDMPKELRTLAAQNMGKIGAMQDLLHGVEKLLGQKKEEKVIQQVVSGGPSVEALLQRGMMSLEDRDWDGAKGYFDRVLDSDAKNANAYLGLYMAERRATTLEMLGNMIADMDSDPALESRNYERAVRFASGQLAERYNMWEKNRVEAKKRRDEGKIEKQHRLDDETEKVLETLRKTKSEQMVRLLESNLKYEKEKLQQISKVVNDYDENMASVSTALENIEILRTRVSGLMKEYGELGRFAGRRRAQIEAEMKEYENQIIEFEKAGAEAANKLCGYPSKQEADAALHDIKEKIKEIEAKINQNKNDTIPEYSYEKAIEIVKTIPFVREKAFIEFLGESLAGKRIGDTVQLGNYYGEYNKDDIILKPIEWLVLTKENGRLLLISKYALDCMPYNMAKNNTTWETCSLRTWLNQTFLNTAFDKFEREMILPVTVGADKNPKFNTNPGKTTKDKVFLLSIKEASEYFLSDEARKCVPTPYAISRGAKFSDSHKVNGKETCAWWLRTPGSSGDCSADVDFNGSIYAQGSRTYNGTRALRPALWFDLGT